MGRTVALGAGIIASLTVTAGVAYPGVRDISPRQLSPTLVATPPVSVAIFTAVDCPISDRYAPELKRIVETFGARGVRFALVYPNHGDTPAAVEAHARAFGYDMPIERDLDGALTAKAGVTVTPEVAVIDSTGRVAYRGRIDDRHTDFGVDRPSPTRRDLAEALSDLLAGRPVAVPTTRAIGCAIVRAP